MIGYRTFIVAGLMAILGITARYGFNFDPALVADAMIGVFAAVMILMRAVTRTPMGKKR